MFKSIKRSLLALTLMLGSAFAVGAQQMPELPVDSAVRIGHLDNGLTYYIRHNETPKGQADFYIAQKVGSILEEDSQRGLAHFLEHMCFNGTENFPGNAIIDWLESVGVKFGQNLNAYTSVDETVYNISNVPVARKSVQDSCLLILHDWADGLLLAGEEIDKERGVIHQEWRRSMVGQMRILEKILPKIYPGNRYGERLPIGTMDVVDNFPYQALRDYYEAWYRPDQQGIVVVGDIDPDYIEAKIKEYFSPVKMPENAKVREYFAVEDTPGTIYAIGSDPEQPMAIVDMMFKTDAFPDSLKNTPVYLMTKYMVDMVETMLDQRLTDLGKKPDAPFAQAGAGYDNFLLAKTKDAFDLTAIPKGNDVLPALEAAYRELLRAQRGGFTVGEYDRAKAEYLSRLEKAYNGREKRESESYVNEYVRHFIDNEPIPSLEDEYKLMQQVIPMIPVDAINQILPQLITADNRVLMVLTPQNDEFKVPTEAELAAVIAKVDAETIEPYKDEMKSEPLIPQLPAPGKVTSIKDDAQWGAKVLTLSNGLKVIVKPTEFKKDEIIFSGAALGGTAGVPDSQANNLIFLPYAVSQHGLGDYTNTDLQKYLQGKQAHVSLSLGTYNTNLDGSSTVKDLPTLMELIYMTMTNLNITADEFQATQNMYNGVLANQQSTPQFIFQRDLNKSLYASAASQMITTDVINAADREGILKIVHDATANAADFTFVFVGDINIDTFVPLAEQYLATIPGNAKKSVKAVTPNLAREVAGGKKTDTFTTKMETPQTWVAIVLNAELPYTAKNRALNSIAAQILSNRLLKKIREEMGAVYSIGASGFMQRTGKNNAFIQIPFPMKPEMKNEVITEIDKMIQGMTSDVTADELNPIKEFMVKSATEAKEKNDDWCGTISATALNGVDVFNGNVEMLNSITTADVMGFMKALLQQNNYRTVILDPAE